MTTTEQTAAIKKAFAKGDKRGTAIAIMTKFNTNFPEGHVFEDCTKEISETLGIPESGARSYYTFIMGKNPKKECMIEGFIPSKPTGKKTRTPKDKTIVEVPMTPEAKADRLSMMKEIAKKKNNPANVTKRIEELAASGAHHQIAETESTEVLEEA